jgi:hypothetical protein
VSRGGAWTIGLLALAVLGCRGELRFDEDQQDDVDAAVADASRAAETSEDAAAPERDGPGADALACEAGCGFGFTGEDCSSPPCRLECHAPRVCSGGCGAGCAGECEGSRCTLAAGDRANLHCEEGAHCMFAGGAGSAIRCASGAFCEVRCLGACSVTCSANSTCKLACGPDGVLHDITVSATCP